MVVIRIARGGLSAALSAVGGSDTPTANVQEFYVLQGNSTGNSVEENQEITQPRGGFMQGYNIFLDNNSRDTITTYEFRVTRVSIVIISIPAGVAGLHSNLTSIATFNEADQLSYRWNEPPGIGTARIEGRAAILFQ